MKSYVLSSGRVTDRLEYYIMDLFRLYLCVYPGDVPGSPEFGFNFSFGNVFRADLYDAIVSKVNELVSIISSRFNENEVRISIVSLDIIDEELAKLVISVNKLQSEEITVKLYNSIEE